MKILYFGNPYIQEDSLPIRVANRLSKEFRKTNFEFVKDTFDLIDAELDECILMDVAENLGKVKLIDADKIKTRLLSSLHDFDIGFYLNFLGQKAKIIAIPINYNEDMAVDECREIIKYLI